MVFEDTWQSYVYRSCTKTALKQVLLKRTITQTNFQITSWLGLLIFLVEFYQIYKKPYP